MPAGHYRDALLTKDTIAIEPDVLEYKLYAPGVGPVLTLGVSGGGGARSWSVDVVDDEAAHAAGTTPLGRDIPRRGVRHRARGQNRGWTPAPTVAGRCPQTRRSAHRAVGVRMRP